MMLMIENVGNERLKMLTVILPIENVDNYVKD